MEDKIIEMKFFQEPSYRSEIKIGNITCYNEKKFNWLNRFMMKIIFGWEVKNYKKGKDYGRYRSTEGM